MNILLVSPDGIGDVILTLPVASELRRLVPDVRIGFSASPAAAPMIEHHPDIDYIRIIRWTDPLRDVMVVFQGVDAAIFLKPFRGLMWAAFLARVPIRVATGYRWYSMLANRRVYQHRKHFTKHESEYNLDLLRGLGIDPGPLIAPVLVLTESERQWSMNRLGGLPAPRIVVHPGGITTRHWNRRRYWELACRMAEKGIGVVVTGSSDERASFLSEVPGAKNEVPGILNLMGELNLRELMGVVACARALVSGSTGPAHIAAAMDVPTVSLFDPRQLSAPIRWRPLGKGIVLQPAVPTCPRCINEECPYWDCLDRITTDYVVEHLQQVISSPQTLNVLHV